MSKVLTDKRGNKWRYRFEIAASNGTRKYHSKSGFSSQKEAYAEGVKAKAKYDRTGIIFNPTDMCFSDYLDYWMKVYCAANCKDTTIDCYQKRIRLYIKPKLGSYSLLQLSPATMQTFINDLVFSGLSKNTVIDIKGILTNSLSYAVLPLEFIESSPMVYVKIPAAKKIKRNSKKHIFVEPQVWEQVISRFPFGHPSHLPLMIAYHCGLRLGEVFGLCWDDFNETNKTLTVKRQAQYNSFEKKWEMVPPKYDSYRTILLGKTIYNVLLQMKELYENNKNYYEEHFKHYYLKNGFLDETDGKPINLMMVRDNGTYIQSRTMTHVMRVIHGKTKSDPTISEQLDFHSLRHTHATMLFQSGIPLPVIQERLGHSNIDVTELYTNHVTAQMNNQLFNTINQIF